jgi:hypothetical protein
MKIAMAQKKLALQLAAKGKGLATQIPSNKHVDQPRVRQAQPDTDTVSIQEKPLINTTEVITGSAAHAMSQQMGSTASAEIIDTVQQHNADVREEPREAHNRQEEMKTIHAMWFQLTGLDASGPMISESDDRYVLHQRIQQFDAGDFFNMHKNIHKEQHMLS